MTGWPWWFNYLRVVGLALFFLAAVVTFLWLEKRRLAGEEDRRFKRSQIRRFRGK